MTSCERNRCSPYSEDIRWRIVWQRFVLDYSSARIAQNLAISVSTVRRMVLKFELTGTVSKKAYPADKAFRKITEPVKFFILHLVLRRPGIYLREVVSELRANFHLEITESAVCKFIKKMNFTRQKLTNIAIQRDEGLRQVFRSDAALYPTNTLVFVDETGTKRLSR